MSFDFLRQALPGFDAWILVLDTKGINVWCAAGKGTFGTDELVGRIDAAGLTRVVSHRELILPQLGGPGVAAHEVKKRSDFRVIYGPVCASDLPAFLKNGLEATSAMRTKGFNMLERLVLVPIELVAASKRPYLLSPPLLFSRSSLRFLLVSNGRVHVCRLCRSGHVHFRGCRLHASIPAMASRQSFFNKGARGGSCCRPSVHSPRAHLVPADRD